MTAAQAVIARKYAKAYMRVFGPELALSDYKVLDQLYGFMGQNRRIPFFLALHSIDAAIKMRELQKLFEKFEAPESLNRLVKVLLADDRCGLLVQVIKQVILLYEQQRGLESFVVASSHELDEKEVVEIQQFLEETTGLDILCNYKIDKALIAGLRLQSDTHLWEYSVRKHLQRMHLPLIR